MTLDDAWRAAARSRPGIAVYRQGIDAPHTVPWALRDRVAAEPDTTERPAGKVELTTEPWQRNFPAADVDELLARKTAPQPVHAQAIITAIDITPPAPDARTWWQRIHQLLVARAGDRP